VNDWEQFARTTQDTAKVAGAKPSAWQYLLIKATDNSLEIAVFVLTLIFTYIGLFIFDSTQLEKTNWALHAAELCLGVFLGLLKTNGKNK